MYSVSYFLFCLQDLCDPSLTCFEPEAEGNLVQGA